MIDNLKRRGKYLPEVLVNSEKRKSTCLHITGIVLYLNMLRICSKKKKKPLLESVTDITLRYYDITSYLEYADVHVQYLYRTYILTYLLIRLETRHEGFLSTARMSLECIMSNF